MFKKTKKKNSAAINEGETIERISNYNILFMRCDNNAGKYNACKRLDTMIQAHEVYLIVKINKKKTTIAVIYYFNNHNTVNVIQRVSSVKSFQNDPLK